MNDAHEPFKIITQKKRESFDFASDSNLFAEE
jgi:hypothetical protein